MWLPRPSESVPFGGEARAGQPGLEAGSLTPSRDFSTVATLDQPRNAKRSLKRIALSPRRSLAAERAPTDPPTLAVADRAGGRTGRGHAAGGDVCCTRFAPRDGRQDGFAGERRTGHAGRTACNRVASGGNRQSGEPYAMHPIAVATILAHMQLDAETIAAALLHDVIEDTPITLERVESQFGGRVARLVDGVTKLGRIPWTATMGRALARARRRNRRKTCARCSSPWSTTSAWFSSSWLTDCTTCEPSTRCHRSKPALPADAGDLRATREQTRHLAIQVRARGSGVSRHQSGGVPRVDA